MAGESAGQGRIVDHQLLLDRGQPSAVLVAQHRDLPRDRGHTSPARSSAHAKPSRGTTPVGRPGTYRSPSPSAAANAASSSAATASSSYAKVSNRPALTRTFSSRPAPRTA